MVSAYQNVIRWTELAEIKYKDYSGNFNKLNLRPALVNLPTIILLFSMTLFAVKQNPFLGTKNIQQPDNDYCLEVSFLIDNYWSVDGS